MQVSYLLSGKMNSSLTQGLSSSNGPTSSSISRVVHSIADAVAEPLSTQARKTTPLKRAEVTPTKRVLEKTGPVPTIASARPQSALKTKSKPEALVPPTPSGGVRGPQHGEGKLMSELSWALHQFISVQMKMTIEYSWVLYYSNTKICSNSPSMNKIIFVFDCDPPVRLSLCLSLCFVSRRLKDVKAEEVDVSEQHGQVDDITLHLPLVIYSECSHSVCQHQWQLDETVDTSKYFEISFSSSY